MKRLMTLILALTMVFSLASCGTGRSIEAVVIQTAEGIETCDGDLMLNTYPDEIIQSMMEEYHLTREELTEQFANVGEMMKKIDATAEITVDSVSYYTGSDLDNIRHDLEDKYGIPSETIKSAASVLITETLYVSGEEDSSNSEVAVMVKIQEDWYMTK